MPSLNQARFIGQSIQSVLTQDYQNIELIVADGGSTDGTLEILEKLAHNDARLRWFSEPDSGPANAVNKAIKKALGTIIGWLNSDDIFAEGAITRAWEALENEPNVLLVYGHAEHIDENGSLLGRYPSLPPRTPISRFSQGCFICQPTAFFRRTLPLLLGPLDESLHTAFDFDYWLRAFDAFPERIGFVEHVQAKSRLHASCITLRNRRIVTIEGISLLKKHLGSAPREWMVSFIEECLASLPLESGIPDYRRQSYAMLDELQTVFSPQDIAFLRNRIKSDGRFDAGVFPIASNKYAPSKAPEHFRSAISVGYFCHAAEVLRRVGYRQFSGPFDWLFSNIDAVSDCLTNDFACFLDKAEYELVPPEIRAVPEANICDHRAYRDKFGVRFFFNHHDPTSDEDYAHFERCVSRFRNLRGNLTPTLFLMVSVYAYPVQKVEELARLLREYVGPCSLVAVRFLRRKDPDIYEDPKILQKGDDYSVIDFPVASASNGVVFPDESDNDRFEAFVKTFAVSPGPALQPPADLLNDTAAFQVKS